MSKNDLQAAANLLRDSESFLITGHANPDGDSLGSMCALGLALRGMGKTVVLVSMDGVPDLYRFLPASDTVVTTVSKDQSFDVMIIVDCEGLDRCGDVVNAIPIYKKLLVIDHHPGGELGEGIRVIDPSLASSGEIVYALLNKMSVPITQSMAECLLTAIVTDTGSFRFSNVTSSTLRTAADLLDQGASVSEIAQKVYETRPLSSIRLLGMALSTLRTASNGRIAYTSVTQAQMAASGATEAETEGIVNYVRGVRGVQVGILFREGSDGSTRVSLRSGDGLDVSQVARLFGGGGHKAAAGCTIERPLEESIGLVVDAVQKWMES